MDVYRVGAALLRSSQPLLPFLAPSAYRIPHATRTAAARHCRPSRNTTRAFTTSHCQCQRAQSAAAEAETDSPSQNFPSTAPSSTNTVSDQLSSLLDDSLDLKKGTPTTPTSRTSHFSSREAQTTNRTNTTSSIDHLLSAMSKPNPRTRSNRPQDITDIFSSLVPSSPAPLPDNEIQLKLGPSLGRTIKVDDKKAMDVARAFRTLEMECSRNAVRRDFMRQRFHERPGLKRKRLKSERWRRNFKQNFKGVVAQVQKMRKQGW